MDFVPYPQHPQVRRNKINQDAASREAEARAENLHEVQHTVDRLKLLCRAMWEIVTERTELTEEDLINKVNEIDQRDEKMDGKVGKKVNVCPSCSRPNNR